jgi:hypothetical protein
MDEDAVRCGLNEGAGAFLDFKFLPQPMRDDHLAFGGKINGIWFG